MNVYSGIESYTRESIGSFDSCLRKMETFKNPRSIQHMAKKLGLRTSNSSMMSSLQYVLKFIYNTMNITSCS